MIDPTMMMGGGGGGPAPGGPPESIQIPGGAPQAGGGGGQSDAISLMQQAKDLLRQALDSEPDEEDKLLIEKMLTEAQQYVATQQKLIDSATGAGPGAKVMRKAAGSQQSPGY